MEGRKAGLTPTLIVLLVLAAAITIIGVVVWMRMARSTVPTQPGRSSGGLYTLIGQQPEC